MNRSSPGEEGGVWRAVKEERGEGYGEGGHIPALRGGSLHSEGRGRTAVTMGYPYSILECHPGLHDPVLTLCHLRHHHGHRGLRSAAHLHPPLTALLCRHHVFRLQ